MNEDKTTARCPNCGEELRGAYCSGCGQRELDLDRTFTSRIAKSIIVLVPVFALLLTLIITVLTI
jgi:hypothetical protein